MKIPGTFGLMPTQLLRTAVRQFIDDGMSTYASALAYQILFSLFPFFIFLVAIIGFFHLPDLIAWLREQAALLLPPAAMKQVNTVLNELQVPQGGILSAGAAIALWTASAGMRATMNALNAAYGVKEERPTWKVYLLSIIFTLLIAAMILVSSALLLIGPEAMQWLSDRIGFERFFVTLWAWLRWPIAVLLLVIAVAAVYYSAPDVQQNFRFISPGSVLSVFVWILASLGFSWYVQNFGNYNAMYGSIGAVIVLLTYFYLSAAVLLFGAEINAVIERHVAGGKQPGEKTLH